MTAHDLYHDLMVQGFSLSVNGGNLELVPSSRLTDSLRSQIRHYKADLMALLATDGLNKDTHLIKCQQCEHLSLTGSCTKTNRRMMPDALRACDIFHLVKRERAPIQAQPYTATTLLALAEKPLFYHLLDCSICHIQAAQYCLQGSELGKTYDDVLHGVDDAQAIRQHLSLRIDRARISGRCVFRSTP